jgi:hypothetical protein
MQMTQIGYLRSKSRRMQYYNDETSVEQCDTDCFVFLLLRQIYINVICKQLQYNTSDKITFHCTTVLGRRRIA